MIRLSFDSVGEHRRVWLSEQLTVTPRQMSVDYGPKIRDESGKLVEAEAPEPIKPWRVDYDSRCIYVPFRWGMDFLQAEKLPYDLALSGGDAFWTPKRLPDPNHPNATPGQAEFFESIYQAACSRTAILVEAPTGGGKTVAALNTIGRFGQAALVIVPSKALADQWILEAKAHLGLEHEEIGLIQGASFRWKGCKLVVAVIHNLFQKEWPAEFYAYFGTVVWDEAHRLGAPEFCKTMPLFPACRRIAMTATPDRKDGCMKLVTLYFGEVAVRMNSEALACEARPIVFDDPFAHKIAHLPPPTLLKILSRNQARNTMINDAVVRMHRRGRKVLVLSDRIEHLQTLQSMAIKSGVPKDCTALYVGSYKAGGKTKQVGQNALREIRENPGYTLIYATYAMMKEGTNIPRMDAGLDALPRADGIQAIGRIRRPFPGKPLPVWFTVVDTRIPIFLAFAKARLRDYERANVKVFPIS